MAFLETGAFVGLVAPGETVVIAGGVIAGQGEIELLPLIGIVWTCAILGDTTSFFIGRRLGRGFLEKHGPKVRITHERLEQVERYFDRHGGKTILIGRFIGLVRALAPFIAGSSGMRLPALHPLQHRRHRPVGDDLLRARLLLLALVRPGRQHRRPGDRSRSASVARDRRDRGRAYRRRATRSRELRRSTHERHPLRAAAVRGGAAGVPAAGAARLRRVWRPQLRFLWERITPGRARARAHHRARGRRASGSTSSSSTPSTLSGDPGPTPLDTRAARPRRQSCARRCASTSRRSSPRFGSLPIGRGSCSASRSCWRRSGGRTELSVLVDRPRARLRGGAHHEGSDRPAAPARPARRDLAVVATRAGTPPTRPPGSPLAVIAHARRPGSSRAPTLVVVAIVIAAAIGASRIYLRAHYWSDVAGGWGLGYGIFGAAGPIALIVAYLRHNGGEPAPERRRAASDEPRLSNDRDRSRPGRRTSSVAGYIAFILVPGLGLLRRAVGAGRGELPDALHPRDAARHRRGRSDWPSSGPTTSYALGGAVRVRRARSAGRGRRAGAAVASSRRSTRSRRRSSPAPGCPRSPARPAARSTRA